MPPDLKRRGLGMGLSALFGEDSAAGESDDRPPRLVAVAALRPGRYQPRRGFDPEALAALAQSIREKGVLQPLLVRPHPSEPDCFEIIAGERRWRAAQQARLHEVPVVLRAFSDRDAAEISLIENLQRQDLNPLEEAHAFRRLMDEFDRTQDDLARVLGKSRSHIANTLRLLDATPKVQELLARGALTAGHARQLVGIAEPDSYADEITERGLTVRQTEALLARKTRRKPPPPREIPMSADTKRIAEDLTMRWDLKVEIHQKLNNTGGLLTVRYHTLEELERFLKRVK